jgi:hypothetical protein
VQAVEGLLADARRGLEPLDGHRVRAVVARALLHEAHADAGNLPHEIPAAEPHGLGAQVAGRMIGDRPPRRAAEVGVEARLVPDRPEELGGIPDRGGDPLGGRPVRRIDQRRMLAAHHHRARRVDREHLRAGGDEGLEAAEVRRRLAADRREVPVLPGRHAAALEARHAADLDPVPLEHVDGIPAELGGVVLHVAGLEEDGLGARRRRQAAGLPRPCLERAPGEGREQLLPVDPNRLLEDPPGRAEPVRRVRHPEAQAGEPPGGIRGAEEALAEPEAVAPAVLGVVAVDQRREVQLEGVTLAPRVGALHLAELALEAGAEDPLRLRRRDAPDVPIVGPVQEREEGGEDVAVLEAQPAAVADLEGPEDLPAERGRLPVDGLVRLVGEPGGRAVVDVRGGLAHRGLLAPDRAGPPAAAARGPPRIERRAAGRAGAAAARRDTGSATAGPRSSSAIS